MTPAAWKSSAAGGPRALRVFAPIVLIIAGLAAYANQFTVPLLFDDTPSIIWNTRLHNLSTAWSVFTEPGKEDITTAGRPVAALTFAVNHAISGLEPWSYHIVNVAIHLAAGLALFGIVRRTLLLPRFEPRFDRSATALALVIALLWLLHPMQTKAVTYIIQRVESLAGLLMLLTLYCSIRGLTSPHRGRWFFMAVISCLLGMGVKETMVGAPLLVLLYDRTFIARSFGQALSLSRGLYLGLAATWAAMAALLITSPRTTMASRATSIVTPLEYAMTQCLAIVQYLAQALWPTRLIFDYGLSDAGVKVIRDPKEALPWAIVVLALLLGTFWAVIRRSWLGFLGAWFFIILAPTSSIVPIPMDIMAEHRMYLPLAALITLVVIAGYGLVNVIAGARLAGPEGGRLRTVLTLAAIAVALLPGWLAVQRNRDFRSDLAIWSDTVEKRPGNARAQTNLGLALEASGDLDGAIEHQKLAIQIKPDYADAHHNLGSVLFHNQRMDEAAVCFRRALELKANVYEPHANLAEILVQKKKYDEAIGHYQEALRIRPDLVELRVRLAAVLLFNNAPDKALPLLREALRLEPNNASAHHQLAMTLAMQGNFAEAEKHLEEAVRIDPTLPNANEHLQQLRALRRASPK